MNSSRIKIVVLIGLIGIIGILIVQLHWLKQAFDYDNKRFDEKVHIALLEVVKKIYNSDATNFPVKNPINRVSGDYYIVDINKDFDAEVLDFYLKAAFEKYNIATDFDYAIYDCFNDNMVFGNKVAFTNKAEQQSIYFPRSENLVYYFAVRFPEKTAFLLSSVKPWLIITLLLVFILFIYAYSVFILLQQKRYAELQKDFVNNMTHEFKTPLSSILIASDYLAKQEAIANDHRLFQYANHIFIQGKKLNDHIEKVLNIARTDYKEVALIKTKLNLLELIEEAKATILLKYPNTKIDISGESAIIAIDKDHFSSVIFNILENSIKYTKGTPHIRIVIEEMERIYILSFQDNGRGIHKKELRNVFKKFYREPVELKDHVTGFGLGLFYVKKICGLHKFKVDISSEEGRGTTVRIKIPKN